MNAARGSNGYVPNAGAIIGVPPKLIVDKNAKKMKKIILEICIKKNNFFTLKSKISLCVCSWTNAHN